MRVLLDACVLYPTVLREILLGAAKAGLFQPLWSARILEEWARAVAKNLPGQAGVALAEIALLRANWPEAEIGFPLELQANLYLPDPDDIHVLAAAIAGKADALVTANLRDFPSRILASHNILRRDPDGFVFDLWQDNPAVISKVCEDVRLRAEVLSGQPQPLRALLKKARLPRLGKALA
ncbi:MAG: PIN domain-containing protein [Alphaproteobacteria bacterium]|nr:PIN domain-containing protein [Alphaproteobacteria bacterium]